MSTTGAVLGASTTAAGVAVLPNTGNNLFITICTLAMIVAGSAVVVSFAVTRLAGKFTR